jgi:hypothetical protein
VLGENTDDVFCLFSACSQAAGLHAFSPLFFHCSEWKRFGVFGHSARSEKVRPLGSGTGRFLIGAHAC